MSYPALLSKPAIKLSLFASAIAGSFLVTSSLPTSLTPTAPQTMQVFSERYQVREAPEVDRVAVMATAFSSTVAIALGLNALLDRKKSAQVQTSRQPGNIRLNQVSYPLQQKLLRLLHDDRGAADRLVAQANFKYPGKTPNWYVEKVIYDLERDRGRY